MDKINLYWWKGDLERRKFLINIKHRVSKGYPLIIRNFGDWLSPLIVSRLSGREVRYSKKAGKLISLGSIFINVKPGDTVWGTGVMNPLGEYPTNIRVCAVRGPLSYDVLSKQGIFCPNVYGDPGILISNIYRVDQVKKYRVGIIPHFEDFKTISLYFKNKKKHNVHVINPLSSVFTVLREINECETVLSSSLHGVIVSESYGIKASLFIMSDQTGGGLFKYKDYYLSTERSLEYISWEKRIDLDSSLSLAINNKKNPINNELKNNLILSFPYLCQSISSIQDIETVNLQ